MIDQQQFAPPQRAAEEESGPVLRQITREQACAIACDVALQLGAPQAEVLSCLRAKFSDAKGWLTARGADDAPIWLVIVRAAVGMPRPGGSVYKAQRLEYALDATDGRTLGFRLAN
ncbi:MAG TPA: hypothetical protein VGP33_17565 [Chloroflexota bacterium]|jgi:hypothetical protein|nr:hypothetical protein [Chloroflexota bacterium]